MLFLFLHFNLNPVQILLFENGLINYIQCQLMLNLGSFRGVDMHKYEPKTFVTGNREDWRADLVKAFQSLPEEPNKIVRMSDYVDYLKSRCPLYQSTWMFVKVNPFNSRACITLLKFQLVLALHGIKMLHLWWRNA